VKWSRELVLVAPREVLIDLLSELMERMGFRNHEKVKDRKEWGIDLVAIRDDPLAGTEKLVVVVHPRGLATSREVNVFAEIIGKHKADRGILVSPAGFTKDARLLVSKEYRAQVIPWDGDKLVSLFQNYGLEPPEELVEKARELRKSLDQRKEFEDVELDAPLLFEFSSDDVIKRVVGHIVSKYPIKEEDVEPVSLHLRLSTAYIFSWSDGEQKDRAVVFSKDKIVVRSGDDEKLRAHVTKAMLNDASTIRVTGKDIEVPLSPSESVLVFKGYVSRALKIPELKVRIHDRRKVYVPLEATLEVKVGENSGTARVDLEKGAIDFRIEPLPDEYFIERAGEFVEEHVSEKVKDISLEVDNWKVKVSGETARFRFEAMFNKFTGKLIDVEILMRDEALEKLIKKKYPRGKIVYIEKGRKLAVVDVLVSNGIAVVRIDLTRGALKEIRMLVAPSKAFKSAKPLIEDNFPVRKIKMDSYRVLGHKFIEINAQSPDGTVRFKIDGLTGDVIDYAVEITRERAEEILREKYGELKVVSVEESDVEYIFTLEEGDHTIKLRISKDGKFIEEIDRVLKREIVEKLAEELVKEIEEDASVKSIELDDNWVVRFAGGKYIGEIVIARASQQVLSKKVNLSEMAVKSDFIKHVQEKYHEEELRTERLIYRRGGGYVMIKLAGRENYYYAKIDTKTGKILSEDVVPIHGLGSKLKRMQLENKYH